MSIERRLVNPQLGPLDTVLPDAVAALKVDSSVFACNIDTANAVTVRTQTGQTIDGSLTRVVPPGAAVLFISDGSGWRALAGVPGPPSVQGCRVFNSANISIPNSSVTTVTFDSERFDTDNMHSLTTQPERITINTKGRYIVGFSVQSSTTATGAQRLAYLRVNGSTYIGITRFSPNALGVFFQVVAVYDFAAGDYIEAQYFQDSGGPDNLLASGNNSPEFWAHRL